MFCYDSVERKEIGWRGCNMVQNKKHCQPRMRIHGICISRSVSLIAFLSPFFLITTRRSAFSLFIHCVSSTSLPIARSPSLPLCGLPPLSLKCPSCCVSLHPPSSLHLHCLTSPLSPPPNHFLTPCVTGLRTELVHVELAGGWRHCPCLIYAF